MAPHIALAQKFKQAVSWRSGGGQKMAATAPQAPQQMAGKTLRLPEIREDSLVNLAAVDGATTITTAATTPSPEPGKDQAQGQRDADFCRFRIPREPASALPAGGDPALHFSTQCYSNGKPLFQPPPPGRFSK